jgi:acyl-CoA synthetase (AMP-forming)/AMP-acid ligase II
MSDSLFNLARHLPPVAEKTPDKPAVVFPAGRNADGSARYTQLTFAELTANTDAYARGFRKLGVEPGMRVILMVRPGLEFLPLTFSLFKIGAVPVLIDPGMGKDKLLRCIETVNAEVFVGIPLAHMLRLVKRKPFRTVKIHVTIGRRWFWGGYGLKDLHVAGDKVEFGASGKDDPAAIIFTTGSTGPPKGVEYTHGMFEAQRQLLMSTFEIGENDVDMPGFILFAIFSLAMGMTVAIPEMDPTRPAEVDPTNIINAVTDNKVTFSFGSPALWNRVGNYCAENKVKLPTLRRVIMAGAPVPSYLHETLLNDILAPDAKVMTPYGATESLPVTSITGTEVLAETDALTRRGKGVCVGRPLPGIDVRIIEISDEPVASIGETTEMQTGEIGELIIRGPNVSRRYFNLEKQTALHKILDDPGRGDGTFWHRIGDVGYFDDKGRVWFCGRKAHRVRTANGPMFTVCCEAVTNQHADVFRSALVGVGGEATNRTPVMTVELHGDRLAEDTLRDELLTLLKANPLTASIDTVLFHPKFPVDIRHNAKIFREKLRVWAADELG